MSTSINRRHISENLHKERCAIKPKKLIATSLGDLIKRSDLVLSAIKPKKLIATSLGDLIKRSDLVLRPKRLYERRTYESDRSSD